MAAEITSLFRTRVPASRLRNAEKILARLGMKPGDAFNMLLAQIELRDGLPFEVTIHPSGLLAPETQAAEWEEALGAY
jgi:antitoxin component of RelBE/YafQ-DinJ toxin-antitoxin module